MAITLILHKEHAIVTVRKSRHCGAEESASKFFLDPFSFKKKDQIPISALTARKHSTAKSRSSLVCPADTWVRIRAFPWGTTG